MVTKKGSELLGFCCVYYEACTTLRAYNDSDQALMEWVVERGMPREEIFYKGCSSGLVNK